MAGRGTHSQAIGPVVSRRSSPLPCTVRLAPHKAISHERRRNVHVVKEIERSLNAKAPVLRLDSAGYKSARERRKYREAERGCSREAWIKSRRTCAAMRDVSGSQPSP